MSNPEYQNFIIRSGHMLAPFILKSSLRPMKDHELVSLTESTEFASWPERSQAMVHCEINERMHTTRAASA